MLDEAHLGPGWVLRGSGRFAAGREARPARMAAVRSRLRAPHS